MRLGEMRDSNVTIVSQPGACLPGRPGGSEIDLSANADYICAVIRIAGCGRVNSIRIVELTIIREQHGVVGWLPHQRQEIAVLCPAYDTGIAEVEAIIACVELDRTDAAFAERIRWFGAVKLAALVAARVAACQEVTDFGIAAEEGRPESNVLNWVSAPV